MAAPGSKKRRVHPEVKAAIVAWGNAPDLDQAASTLSEARRRMDPAHLAELRAEVAEITAETMVEVLALEQGVVQTDPVEILGLTLYPKQVERLGAWLHDQEPTAKALGVDMPAWSKLVEQGLERYRAAQLGKPLAGPAGGAGDAPAAIARNLEAARKLLDEGPKRFENRPAPGTSKSAGVLGAIAARAFPPKDKGKGK